MDRPGPAASLARRVGHRLPGAAGRRRSQRVRRAPARRRRQRRRLSTGSPSRRCRAPGLLAWMALAPLFAAAASAAAAPRRGASACCFGVGRRARHLLVAAGDAPALLRRGAPRELARGGRLLRRLRRPPLRGLRRLARAGSRGAAPFRPPLVALGWAACEWARGSLGVANPWALSAYSQVDCRPIAQLADLAGPCGIAALLAARERAPRRRLRAGAAARAAAAGRGGALRPRSSCASRLRRGTARPRHRRGARPARGRVQGGIARPDGDGTGDSRAELERYLALTGEAVAAAAPDLVLWPEGALDFSPFEATAAHAAAARRLAGARRRSPARRAAPRRRRACAATRCCCCAAAACAACRTSSS